MSAIHLLKPFLAVSGT